MSPYSSPLLGASEGASHPAQISTNESITLMEESAYAVLRIKRQYPFS